jgi:SAM-dependent methyltransferase
MDDHVRANRELWDRWTLEHEKSDFYDVEGFRSGKDRLRSIELAELGDVKGKSLIHLQCHFGLDTLAWARRGAIVTGVDLSPNSIELAQSLAREVGLNATFICSDIGQLNQVLSSEFDIVFTSYGVLHWIRDMGGWADTIARLLKPGGVFYIVEDHPFFRTLTPNEDHTLEVANPYFFSEEPDHVEMSGSYATSNQGELRTFYIWNHSIGEVVNALLTAGLSIEFLHEFPFAARAKYSFMVQGEDGWWYLPQGSVPIPFLFSIRAHKP